MITLHHLFPESSNQTTFWRETRDLLVFRIYETLHDWLVTNGFADDAWMTETEQSTNGLQEDN